jgi:hypothetical protein
LEGRGWSKDEIFTFAKDTIAASAQVDRDTGMLTAHLYYESACELLRNNHPVQPFSQTTAKLASCLHLADDRAGLQCASRLIQ